MERGCFHDDIVENMSTDLSVEMLPCEDRVMRDGANDTVVGDLTRVLIRALRELGERGDPEGASRLAAQAWAITRGTHGAVAQRLAGLLHYLSRLRPEIVEDAATEKSMSASDQLLDVRAEAPSRRHDLIFETYTSLAPGTGFVLVNDHDPKPLYYQLTAEHAADFTWQYIEEGPEVWLVRIGRPAASR